MALDSTGTLIVAMVSIVVLLVSMVAVVVVFVKSGSGKVSTMPGAVKHRRRSLGLENVKEFTGEDDEEEGEEGSPQIEIQGSSFDHHTHGHHKPITNGCSPGNRSPGGGHGTKGLNPFSSLEAADGGSGVTGSERDLSPQVDKYSNASGETPPLGHSTGVDSGREWTDSPQLGVNAGDLTVESFNSRATAGTISPDQSGSGVFVRSQ